MCSILIPDKVAQHELAAPDAPLGVDADSPPLSLGELESEICELGAHIAAATCRWLTLIAEFDERRGWAADGIKSCAHWLSWRCSIGLGTAREHVRVAVRLRELPLVREAFSRGQLSFCKVRAITRIATIETEAELLELGRHATGAQLEKIVRGFCRAQRATLEQARETHERRSLSWDWEEDGSLSFEGRLPAEDGALLLAALTAAEGPALTGAGPEDVSAETPVGGTPYERRADALAAVARAALAFGKTRRSSADPVELVVHVDAVTLAAERISERCELHDGPALAPETARRLGCDAAVTRIVERDGRPLSVSRRTRTIPPALRRALRSRDSGCRFPGCTHSRFLHAHHIHHWAKGGETKLDNLVQLCSYHHRLVHEGGFTVERPGSGGLRFRRPDGRVIAPAGGSRPATGSGCAEQNRALGLHIDGNTCTPVSAGGPLDYSIAVGYLLAKTPAPP
ncbi:MAG: DUF222 domain-containing protein [Solirubrobacterales bacterium]|nr:DUF222 domain-containing protein [Solirubrobacterales bacterium]